MPSGTFCYSHVLRLATLAVQSIDLCVTNRPRVFGAIRFGISLQIETKGLFIDDLVWPAANDFTVYGNVPSNF
jgi:hypothetical protein